MTTPAQVIVNSISNTVTPNISANVTITNEGLSGNEYQYQWCVVSSLSDPCGSGTNIFDGVAAKYINAGQDFNTTLTATVPHAGTYYFKVIAYFGTDSSISYRSFTATSPANNTGGNPGGGPGGGAGGAAGPPPTPDVPAVVKVCGKKADFNCDTKVNEIDFSILLYFWKSKPPFANKYVDLNNDNKVDTTDFSILLYNWGK